VEKEGHFVRNWKRRWMVLVPGIIQYFEDEPFVRAPFVFLDWVFDF
jgi:hypothetical protein